MYLLRVMRREEGFLLTERQDHKPKELVLFFKNLLYLNGFAAALAPDANLLDEIEPIFMYFATRYPQAIELMTNG